MPTSSENRANLLGTFLRSHRERIEPSAGQLAIKRRRTPGLRREEVAQMCGVSTTWYTWLEQGRPVSASAGTLSQISSALRLTHAERMYLFEIAHAADPVKEEHVPASLPDGLTALIHAASMPVYLLDRQWNAIVWNRAAATLFRVWLKDWPSRNLLHFVFLSPAAKDLIPDWDRRTRRIVAEFRSDAARHLEQAPTNRLVRFLCGQSAVFARLWEAQDVSLREGHVRKIRTNRGKILEFEQVALIPSGRDDLKLISLIPK